MKHLKLFENENSNNVILKDFIGVKFDSSTIDSETNKKITKLAKEHKIFLLVTHSGVKYFISEVQADINAFKKSISSI